MYKEGITMTGTWIKADNAPENVVFETKISDNDGERNFSKLQRVGNLWFNADRSAYVYYRPTHILVKPA